MDKVFKAIGRFFKKIWEWIKSTAWVQPLLIVAVIFGIIFSINPIVTSIQNAINADDTGEFYKAHAVQFRDLFAKGIAQQKTNYASKDLLGEKSGKVLVIYVNDNSLEADVATFYNAKKEEGLKLYICNFSTEENQRSKWDEEKEWTFKYDHYQYDNAIAYYDYLLTQLVSAYNDNEADSWRNSYSKQFYAEYGYNVFYPEFKGDETYKETAHDPKDAYSDLKLPAAVLYNDGKVIDMRFASSGSWVCYGNENKSVTNYQVLADLWKGI